MQVYAEMIVIFGVFETHLAHKSNSFAILVFLFGFHDLPSTGTWPLLKGPHVQRWSSALGHLWPLQAPAHCHILFRVESHRFGSMDKP
jgi:hypothetical protein